MTDPNNTLREQVIEAMSWSETFADGRIGATKATELLDDYMAAARTVWVAHAKKALSDRYPLLIDPTDGGLYADGVRYGFLAACAAVEGTLPATVAVLGVPTMTEADEEVTE